jgi:flagellar capping protein FliD
MMTEDKIKAEIAATESRIAELTKSFEARSKQFQEQVAKDQATHNQLQGRLSALKEMLGGVTDSPA